MSPATPPAPGSLTNEWRKVLSAAQTEVHAINDKYPQHKTGEPLRHLFSTLLSTVGVHYPDAVEWGKLWEEFRETICLDLRASDIPNVSSPTDTDVCDYGLHMLDLLLRETDKRLKDFTGMPQPEDSNRYGNVPLQLHADPSLEEKWGDERRNKLRPAQQEAFDAVTGAALLGQSKVFFLDGPAGTGKTTLYNCVSAFLKAQKPPRIVITVAPTSTAATLLRGGRPASETFRLPPELKEDSECRLKVDGHYASVLKHAHVLIWDEAGNQHRFAIEAVDRYLRGLRGNQAPFGGMTVLFGGDFRQLAPSVPQSDDRPDYRPDEKDIVGGSLQSSELWKPGRMTGFSLTENLRLLYGNPSTRAEDQKFVKWLTNVSEGRGDSKSWFKELQDRNMLRETEDEFLSKVYSPIVFSSENDLAVYFGQRAILARENATVRAVNSTMLERFNPGGLESVSTGLDTLPAQQPQRVATNALDVLKDGSLRDYLAGQKPFNRVPPRKLSFKEGCPIILLHDLCPAGGLFNGSRMIILKATGRLLVVRIIGEDHQWRVEKKVPRIAFIPYVPILVGRERTKLGFDFIRQQFPVDLVFAMTIAKAQGQSFKAAVGVDLRQPISDVDHGLFYVAMSRAKAINGTHVLLSDTDKAKGEIKNIVFQGILLKPCWKIDLENQTDAQ